MIIKESSPQLEQLNEMFVRVEGGLSPKVENSIYYAKLKNLLHSEIMRFCKEQIELKDDLTSLRMSIGENVSESDIREAFDALKNKYNFDDNNVGLDYHIEATRIDFGVSLFVVIKRDNIYMKKFVFRYRKSKISHGLEGLTQSGIFTEEEERQMRKDRFNGIWKGDK